MGISFIIKRWSIRPATKDDSYYPVLDKRHLKSTFPYLSIGLDLLWGINLQSQLTHLRCVNQFYVSFYVICIRRVTVGAAALVMCHWDWEYTNIGKKCNYINQKWWKTDIWDSLALYFHFAYNVHAFSYRCTHSIYFLIIQWSFIIVNQYVWPYFG